MPEQTQEPGIRERAFTQQVIDEAHHHGWQSFHLRDRDSIHIVRGRGFPDLVMYRKKSVESDQIEMIVAELKRSYDSEPRPEQEEWRKAFDQHLPTYLWRPEDWKEIESVLKDGPTSTSTNAATFQAASWQSDGRMPADFNLAINGLVETIEDKEMDRGDKARLRRMNPTNPNTPTFWQFMARKEMPRKPDIRKWGLIVQGIALMSHSAGLAHNSRRSVGHTLFFGKETQRRQGFYSEDRLATLLAARGPTLHRLLARLFRMLAAERCAFNWREMAWFILNESYNEDQAEQARIKIARTYYQAERRNAPQSTD